MIKDITPSKEFKAHTKKAVASIILFAFVYILLFAMALALTAACVYGGIMLVITIPRFITIALGLGLAGMGFLILIFLLKFIFKSHKTDRSHLIEIKKSDEPKIFDMINGIVNEVGTSFPKKVYLSADVNASVFYDSSFWSMFFPIRKNLVIGVGLANTITHDELKAVLSHEFGHFSQKTMKVGSYVYNVNQVIFNMLYDNEGYDKLIHSWASISGYIAIFAIIAVRIVQGIQWILRKMYDVVNKSYMALSREMEFHADEIAANVTGFPPLKSALLRMQLADFSYNNVLSFYDEKVKENKFSQNLYREQSFVMNSLAKESGLPTTNNFPEVTLEELNKYNKSKLVIKDQWASHPSTEDRISKLEQTGIIKNNENNEPANIIFSDYKKTHEKLTQHLFKDVEFKPQEERSPISFDLFQLEYVANLEKNKFSKIYNGYYDHRNPEKFTLSDIHLNGFEVQLEELYSEATLDLLHKENALKSDLETLKLVADKTYDIKTFDYDGKKYRRIEANELATQLNNKLDKLSGTLLENDKNIYVFFKKREIKKGQDNLDRLYKRFFDFDSEFDTKLQLFSDIHQKLEFINQTTPIEEIQANFRHLTSLERRLKNEIKMIMENTLYAPEITNSIRDNLELYLSKDWQYFGKQTYFENNLKMLFEALQNYSHLLSKGYVIQKKELLDYQTTLI